MTPRILAFCSAALFGLAMLPVAQARDDVLHLPVKDVIEDPANQGKLGSDVALFFGKQPTPPIAQSMGEVSTNKKTNAFNKSAEAGCKWVMLAALIQLVEAAHRQGGNAVVGITSDYKRVDFVSDTEYECHAGGFVSGVALKGKVVKLKK